MSRLLHHGHLVVLALDVVARGADVAPEEEGALRVVYAVGREGRGVGVPATVRHHVEPVAEGQGVVERGEGALRGEE